MSSKYVPSSNTAAQNQLIQWINEAGMVEGSRKADLFRKIIEVLLHQAPEMITVYMDNIMSYVNDKSNDVKKQVIAFIEEISKLHAEHLPKVVSHLQVLVTDTVIAVQKRAIQAASIVYQSALQWICKGGANITDMQFVWEHLTKLKLLVLNMIDNDNEGIRTHSIKFLEEVVKIQSPGEGIEEEFSLDNIPSNLPFINRKSLEEESEHIFMLLVKFHNSQHISSVNLMTCMATLCLLAKLRPRFMPRVVQALQDLHTTLPPTLSQSQVNSVRKHLKMQLLTLIKHPSSNEMLPQLTQLLLDLGMTTQELNKAVSKDRRSKRVGEIRNGDAPAKRFRVDSPQSNSQGSDSNSNSRSDFVQYDDDSQPVTKSAVTDDTLLEGVSNVENVVSLVMTTLLNHLPNEMPLGFITSYKPIPNAGSKTQKKSLAKMILALIKDEPAPVITQPTQPQPSLSDIAAKIPLLREDDEKTTLKNAVAKLQESTKADKQIENAVSKLMEETRQEYLKEEEKKATEKAIEKPIIPQTPSVPKLKQKVKLLKLQELTRPIPKEIKERLMLQAVGRILRAEKESAIGGASQIRSKFITIFASSYTPDIRDLVLDYILDDPANQIDLAMLWLYEEYAYMQGFNRLPVTLQPSKSHEKHDQNYNQLLCALITQICERGDPTVESSKDVLLRKIYSESPLITEEAVDYLKHLVNENKVPLLAMEILEELCIMRPPRAHKYVAALVCHVLNETEEIRETCLKSTLKVYQRGSEAVKKVIEKHALLYLGFITLGTPPPELFGSRHASRPWSDELYKLCLNLVMALFPLQEEIIIEVARIYGFAGAEAKRCVLRAVEGPIRALIGSSSNPAMRPAFQALLDECPRGAETLLTRLVHILTEKAPPTPELVARVRELYATRVSDVRFLIPVLNGLSKKEILAALPKLIKLNPIVVKEVFNKLLGLQNPNDEQVPISPEELLVALHLIDPNKADLKYIIKATALCFAEKQTYTQDVLSAVLQRLAEEPDVPVLMMRSVLQALTLHPALAPLALNILQLLVEREVWTNKVAWEGWVKCCERLQGRAAPAIAALPPAALALLPPHLAPHPVPHPAHPAPHPVPHPAHPAPHPVPHPAHPAPHPVPHPAPHPVPHPAQLVRQDMPFAATASPIEPLPPGMD
ncbi:symplekin [Epargyreus clarus]|uniref:symplekin n=1 Tax=Epargyreus clarus TaxID=520877 RepID=UPI003C2DD132